MVRENFVWHKLSIKHIGQQMTMNDIILSQLPFWQLHHVKISNQLVNITA